MIANFLPNINHDPLQYPYDGWSLEGRNPQKIKELMPIWEFFYRYYFRVTSDGWQYVNPEKKALLVGSHNGGLASPDMVMMIYDWFLHFDISYPVYGLMHPLIWEVYPDMAKMAVEVGAVIAHPKMAIAALKENANVLVYPGGAQDVFRPHCDRHKINLAGRKGFIKLALRENVPIIPIISYGAHDTLIVLADFYPQLKQLLKTFNLPWLFDKDPLVFPIYLGLPWGLGIGPLFNFPLPVSIHNRICPPITFERTGRKASCDRQYVNECYELVTTKMQQELDQLVAEKEAP
jgi:1-acyl-sn-glycerol-3-phosphate acyltransferase